MKKEIKYIDTAKGILEANFTKKGSGLVYSYCSEAHYNIKELITNGNAKHKEILFWSFSYDWQSFLESYFQWCYDVKPQNRTDVMKEMTTPFILANLKEKRTNSTDFAKKVVGNHKTVKDFIFSLYNDKNIDLEILDFNEEERQGLYFWLAIYLELDLDDTLENAIKFTNMEWLSTISYTFEEKKWK